MAFVMIAIPEKPENGLLPVLLFTIFLLFVRATGAQTYNPVEDAMVYAGSVNNNYGTDVKLQVKKKEGSSITRNAYLKFNLAGLTVAQVGKAKLRLYCNNKAVDTIQSVMGVFATTNSWTEATIKWSNAPALSGLVRSSVVVAKQNYYEWDITDYVKQPIPAGNLLSAAVADLNQSNNLVEFSSKEAVNKPQLIITAEVEATSTAYYLDAVNGDDTYSGTSPATPWKSLNKLNTSTLSEGAAIYFKSGQNFNGLFNISNTGIAGHPVVCNTYGGAAPATINGQGQPSAVFAYNRSYVELRNLIIKNFRPGVFDPAELFSAVTFINENAGVINHVYLDSVRIDSVNASSDESDDQTVYNGGVRFYTMGSAVPSKFNDVRIQNCTFQNLSRTGCNFRSDWELRNVNTSFGTNLGDGRTDNWVPNTNVVIRGNIFRKIAGNGLIVRVATKALIEGNFFDSCGTVISGNAAFNFNTDSTIYQFNEAQNTVYNDGDTDARGLDADFRTKATIIQYNYLHHNGLGGVVATGGDQTSGQIPQRFNVGTVIRYNLLENNDRQGIAFSGAIDGLDVYNNTLYADATHNDVLIVRSAVWAVAPKNLRFKNNIFFYNGTNLSYAFAASSTYSFQNNLFYGNHPATEPADPNKITGDPKLVNPGNGTGGYKYGNGSAALNSGLLISDNGGRDYYNLPVSSSAPPNLGMYNGDGIGILSVSLGNFVAVKKGQQIQLTWTTVSEMNADQFDIQRSGNGVHFETIGTVKAAGNRTATIAYDFTDKQPLPGRNYYRLSQVDKDGKHQFSVVRIVSGEDATEELLIYPNPATNQVSLFGSAFSGVPVIVSLYDLQGKKLQSSTHPAGAAIDLNISELKRGIYSIQVNDSKTSEVLGKARFLKL